MFSAASRQLIEQALLAAVRIDVKRHVTLRERLRERPNRPSFQAGLGGCILWLLAFPRDTEREKQLLPSYDATPSQAFGTRKIIILNYSKYSSHYVYSRVFAASSILLLLFLTCRFLSFPPISSIGKQKGLFNCNTEKTNLECILVSCPRTMSARFRGTAEFNYEITNQYCFNK